jgi:uncharacterized protein YabN with tetrapyrrole methylase and pyrophosphatase domain
MAVITVIGTGPGPLDCLTKEAERLLLRADKIFFRRSSHPVYDWLEGLGKHVVCFDRLYTLPWPNSEDLYEFITDALLKEATARGQAAYALPGSPAVLEDTTRLLQLRGPAAGVQIRVVHGLSFLEPALAAINFDFGLGLQIGLPRTHILPRRYNPRLPLLVCQIEARNRPADAPRVDLTMKWLLGTYRPDHAVTLIWTAGLPGYEIEIKVIALKDLALEYGEGKYLSSLYIPPIEDASPFPATG